MLYDSALSLTLQSHWVALHSVSSAHGQNTNAVMFVKIVFHTFLGNATNVVFVYSFKFVKSLGLSYINLLGGHLLLYICL